MNANTARHGKAANAATTTHPAAGAGDACRRSSTSATSRAGDVPAADTTGKEATMQPDDQTQNTPAPLADNGKNAARRKASREKGKAKIAAAKMRDREIRAWLKQKGIVPTGKAVRENRDDYIRFRRKIEEWCRF